MLSTVAFVFFLKASALFLISASSPFFSSHESRTAYSDSDMANIKWPRTSSTPDVEEGALNGEEDCLVARHVEIGNAKNERLIAFVRAAVEKVGGLGVGACNDDAGHLHDVELEASGIQALDLLVLGYENFAALMAALLNAGLLVFDVIAGTPTSTKRRIRLRTCASPP